MSIELTVEERLNKVEDNCRSHAQWARVIEKMQGEINKLYERIDYQISQRMNGIEMMVNKTHELFVQLNDKLDAIERGMNDAIETYKKRHIV